MGGLAAVGAALLDSSRLAEIYRAPLAPVVHAPATLLTGHSLGLAVGSNPWARPTRRASSDLRVPALLCRVNHARRITT